MGLSPLSDAGLIEVMPAIRCAHIKDIVVLLSQYRNGDGRLGRLPHQREQAFVCRFGPNVDTKRLYRGIEPLHIHLHPPEIA